MSRSAQARALETPPKMLSCLRLINSSLNACGGKQVQRRGYKAMRAVRLGAVAETVID